MEKEHTSVRLKKIMSDRNLRQIDILELCKPYCQKYNIKLGRNDLSQYVSGKVEPGQKKLTVLGMALGVNEAWLMGFDVPMERNDYEFKDTSGKAHLSFDNVEDFKKAYDKSKFRGDKLATAIMGNVEKLNNDGKKSLLDYSNFLLDNSGYVLDQTTGDVSEFMVDAAHGRTDTEVTEEMIKHDDDIMDDEDF